MVPAATPATNVAGPSSDARAASRICHRRHSGAGAFVIVVKGGETWCRCGLGGTSPP